MAHNIEAILTLKDNMSATLKVAEKNLSKFGSTMQSKGRLLRNFGTTVGYLGKDLLKLNAPMLAVGGWASKLGMDFEAVTSEAQAIMDATGPEMEVFKEKAREVGSATSKSATDAMESMKLLGQAGLSQKEILETTYPLVRLSEAGNLDMARSADLLTNSMKSAEIPMENVGQYLDQITLAGNESNTSIEEQMEAWQSAGGAITSANMSMSEANALLGVMANRGVKGTEAGNSLSKVFQNLNATTGEAGKAMEALDIQTANSDGSLKNKIDVLKELKEKTDAMDESERERYITMIGGKAHTENLKKMLAGLSDEYTDLELKLQGADGALEKMAITMKDNLKGRLETLSSSTEEFGLKLAEVLLPRIEGVVDKIQNFVDKLNEMDEGQLNAIIDTVLFATKLAFLLITIGSVTNTIGKFTFNLGTLTKMFGEGQGLSKLFGVSGLKLIVILGAIGIAIALLIKNWDKIKVSIEKAQLAISEFIDKNVDMDKVKAQFERIGATVSEIAGVFLRFGKVVAKVLIWIGNKVENLVVVIGSSFLDNLPGILGGVMTIFEGLLEFFKGALLVIEGIFTGDFDTVMEGAKSIFSGSINIIKGLWIGLLSLLSIPIEATIKLIEGRFPKVAEFIRAIWGSLKKFLSNPVQGVVNILDWASKKIEKAKEKWEEIKIIMSKNIKGKVDAVTGAFHKGINNVKRKWENLKDFLRHPIKGTVSLVQRGAKAVGNKLGIGNNWQGTPSWRGGPTYLHEKGGEIFDLPGETRVYPHDKSVELAYKDGQASVSKGNSVSIAKLADTIVVREESDIDKIADRLATKIEDVKFNMG